MIVLLNNSTNVPPPLSSRIPNERVPFKDAGVAPNDDAVNVIEFVEIATTGNTTEFGDMNETTEGSYGASSGHGGL